jgi:antitoxin component YwqK of YwqJK toxin-antitoxin module
MNKIKLCLILSVLFSLGAYSQDSIQLSKQEEIKGWNTFFKYDYKTAKVYFEDAIKFNSKNSLAKVGLLVTAEENDFAKYQSYLSESLSEEPDPMQWTTPNKVALELVVQKRVLKQYRLKKDSLAISYLERENNELLALLSDGEYELKRENGSLWRKGRFKNLRPIGKLSTYGNNNQLLFDIIYPETGNRVTRKSYTEKGELAKEEIIEGDPLRGTSFTKKITLFWQEIPDHNPRFLFVSKDGFIIFDKGKKLTLDESTPDNVLQTVYEDGEIRNYIWKDGKRILFED